MPIVVTEPSGMVYNPQTGDVINFGLKEKYEDEELLIEKTIPVNDLALRLEHDDTKVLKPGVDYKYDIQIKKADGSVNTFISGVLVAVNEVYDKD